jgi:hypothetical protein
MKSGNRCDSSNAHETKKRTRLSITRHTVTTVGGRRFAQPTGTVKNGSESHAPHQLVIATNPALGVNVKHWMMNWRKRPRASDEWQTVAHRVHGKME